MCYFNRLTRVARCLADYPEWLQFCWDFVKPPRNDEIDSQHFFFLACSSARIFFLFHLCCMQFFSSNKRLREIFFQNHPLPSPPPPLPQELNGRPLRSSSKPFCRQLNLFYYCKGRRQWHNSEQVFVFV